MISISIKIINYYFWHDRLVVAVRWAGQGKAAPAQTFSCGLIAGTHYVLAELLQETQLRNKIEEAFHEVGVTRSHVTG